MYFDPDNETLPREQLKALQLVRLKATVERCYETVPFYRAAMDELQVKPRHIKTLADVRHLPLTKKEQLRENYPFGMFSVPKNQILRLHASSGTSGKPVVTGYTRRDLENWSKLGARCLVAAGLKAGEKFHNAHGYGVFTGGMGVHGACEMLGMTVIPISGGRTQFQLMMIEDLKPDAMCASPSYAMTIAEEAERQGIDMKKHPLRVGLFGSEPWTHEMRLILED
ncbi:MAG: phenylacetate--CoA ligase, partial [Zoogloeaceae bacterium]|nr:phenylacetate--CoA ligase [Zoogloeaceae bacterium]